MMSGVAQGAPDPPGELICLRMCIPHLIIIRDEVVDLQQNLKTPSVGDLAQYLQRVDRLVGQATGMHLSLTFAGVSSQTIVDMQVELVAVGNRLEALRKQVEALREQVEDTGTDVPSEKRAQSSALKVVDKIQRLVKKSNNWLSQLETATQQQGGPPHPIVPSKRQPDAQFCFAHFSDLHLGAPTSALDWGSIRNGLVDDLRELQGIHGPLDLLFLTGDCSFSAHRTQYGKLKRTLDDLFDALWENESGPWLLTVPGNHDVKRYPKCRDDAAWQGALKKLAFDRKEQESLLRVPQRYKLWTRIRRCFEPYCDWWGKQLHRPHNGIQRGLLPGEFFATIPISGSDLTLGVLGLNTTFLHLREDDVWGALAMHEKQFLGPQGKHGHRWCQKHHIRILLSHHPPQWLNTESRDLLQNRIKGEAAFAFHLCGHEHELKQQAIYDPDGDYGLTIQSRALCGNDVLKVLDEDGKVVNQKTRVHGYSTGVVSVFGTKGILRLWPRKAVKRSGQWVFEPDTEHPGYDNERNDGRTRGIDFTVSRPKRATSAPVVD